MAPREATGAFPDQFLTFDYENALPLGIPANTTAAVPPPVQEAAVMEEQDVPPAAALDALNSVPSAATELHHRPFVSSSANEPHAISSSPIDPLSIDPTLDDDDDDVHAQPTPSPSWQSQQSPTAQYPRTVSPARSAGSPPLVTMASLEDALSPLTTTSHNVTAGLSPTSAARARQYASMLDEANLSDDDDEEEDDDDDIPGLDSTGDDSFEEDEHNNADQQADMMQLYAEETYTQHQLFPTASDDTDDDASLRRIHRNGAFDGGDNDNDDHVRHHHQRRRRNNGASSLALSPGPTNDTFAAPLSPSVLIRDRENATMSSPPTSPRSIHLSFGPHTSVSDLKYFAERGCIVACLQALNTPRLVTLGARMLADYAKQAARRVAVASNRRILEFLQHTMLEHAEQPADWLGREYAVETVRSLTATEASDAHLMAMAGLLRSLALVARGGPFVVHTLPENGGRCTISLASEKARLHACIAIMNLSCGKANKIEIAKITDVLESMRDVMMMNPRLGMPSNDAAAGGNSNNSSNEARLKATTCVKNLSNADANDAALLGTPGLVEALGHVAATTCSPTEGATPCTTNACLALMNLSISKANKHRVFRTPGVMDALMTVLERTTAQGAGSTEARIKACSALSNLAIGYDNKIPMFHYPGFVDSILNVIQTDTGEARTKACSILWSFAAEMKNQVPVVQRGDILPVLVQVAQEDGTTEARFKCVAALTLLAESLENAMALLEAGALTPLMDILHDAGPDPTQWKGQTASWCVGFLMNIAQSDEAVPVLREAGVVELLAPLLTLDHYQSLKAAMAVTFCCRYDKGDECYDLLRKTENVIPKIISLLHNTLSGRGGNGYKYGVFTLRSSVGCIAALASGPDFMKERIATNPVFESLLQVVSDFCVDGGTPGAIVGGGRDDALSATLAIRALQSLTGQLIPMAGSNALPFGHSMETRLLTALRCFEECEHEEIKAVTRQLATDARIRIEGGRRMAHLASTCSYIRDDLDADMGDAASSCCGFDGLPGLGEDFLQALSLPSLARDREQRNSMMSDSNVVAKEHSDNCRPLRTFLLPDAATGRRFVVPCDPSGGRSFNDTRVWCYRRGRFCVPGEEPDPNYVWTAEMQQAYEMVLAGESSASSNNNGPAGLSSGVHGQ